MAEQSTSSLPHRIDPDHDDPEVAALIESWRYRGVPVSWDAIVGHEPQVRRCRELVEALRRSPEVLARLGLRRGRGVVLSRPAGVGKTMVARAIGGALGRAVIAPPVAELTPGLIARLYAQLARMEPTLVVLDEAERVIGARYVADEDCVRALCVALDGLGSGDTAPVTVALTTSTTYELSPTATRPGRLSPQLQLGLPTAEEREMLLRRVIEGLPAVGSIDVAVLVERTVGWSGAELAVAVEEAMSRSLLDATDALTPDNLLAVIGERWVIPDPSPRRQANRPHVALHEAGHALYAQLVWPGSVAMMSLAGPAPGTTSLHDSVTEARTAVTDLRAFAAIALAGIAAEILLRGPDQVMAGSSTDRATATQHLLDARRAARPHDEMLLEQGSVSDRGSERMRAAIHAEVEEDANRLLAEVIATLAPHRSAIERLAARLLDAPELTLSGDDLQCAFAIAFAEPPASGRTV